ncbi:MAG: ribosome silencing factor, partial [Opitutaceae bacterium]|nr:ribosome silencing factor [Verrucomicrobiales bacterium]
DVSKVSSVTDYFVIATGSSEPHIRAIVSEITDRLRTEHDLKPISVDGDIRTPWQVMDFFDVIVHVMRSETRDKYDLESLWGDAPRLKPENQKPKRRRAKPSAKPSLRKGE